MEPTERRPGEAEGNGIAEGGQNWNGGVEAVLAPLIGQVCLYRSDNGPMTIQSCLSPFFHWPKDDVSWSYPGE